MTRALVLGGGGPLGVGWQAGLLTGLADAGLRLGEADYVVGTSAGSIVGAQRSGDLTRAVFDVFASTGKVLRQAVTCFVFGILPGDPVLLTYADLRD